MPLRFVIAALLISPLLAHGSMQSAMHPKGNNAAQIADLAWVLFVGGTVIFVLVMVLAAVALFGTPSQRIILRKQALIVGGGIVFPVVVLTPLLIYTFGAAATMIDRERQAKVHIEVTGELWWWRVRYLDRSGNILFETANEIRIPVGQPVDLRLISADVIHSFWVPNLAGKIDMIPGHVNRLRIEAKVPGIFRGQCAEYCGAQHANMGFHAIALDKDEYQAWLARQMRPAAAPQATNALLLQGRQLFLANRCVQCHAVRDHADRTAPDTGASKRGPDLTHVGSRHAIGAGSLPNSGGSLAGWIVGSQHIKPGNRMPAFKQFSGDELRALAAYLQSLQ